MYIRETYVYFSTILLAEPRNR